MSDMAYIMENPVTMELWLVDGESKFKVSRDMYWLLASKGAELPPMHDISDLLAENAKLREENAQLRQELAIREASEQEKVIGYLRQENVDWEEKYRALAAENSKLRELVRDMWNAGAFEPGACYVHGIDDLEKRTSELGIEVNV